MESQQPRPGLTSVQVRQKRDEFGENSIRERRQSSVLQFLKRFWSPVPWMLEATLILELIVGKFLQGAIIAGLLVLNATLSFLQERRASSALALLRRRLTIMVRVLRDSRWQILPSQELVPGVSGDISGVLFPDSGCW